MNAEEYGLELLQQYENMITNIAEWRTVIYSILQLAQWKKQQQPRMQSDITLIQQALMSPANFDVGEFVLYQVNIMIGYKAIFEQLVESHRSLLQGYQSLLCIDLLMNLEQKTLTLITYFNYVPVSQATLTCIPLAISTIPYATTVSSVPYAVSTIPIIVQEQPFEVTTLHPFAELQATTSGAFIQTSATTQQTTSEQLPHHHHLNSQQAFGSQQQVQPTFSYSHTQQQQHLQQAQQPYYQQPQHYPQQQFMQPSHQTIAASISKKEVNSGAAPRNSHNETIIIEEDLSVLKATTATVVTQGGMMDDSTAITNNYSWTSVASQLLRS